MNNVKRIPIPWSHRWRRLRYDVVPGVFFVLALALTLWLWQRERLVPNALGEVEAVRMDVASSADGMLAPITRGHWALFETVRANDVIARLDDKLVKAQLDVMQKELIKLRGELRAAEAEGKVDEADRRVSYLSDYARLVSQIESSRLDVLDRQVQVEFDQIELKRRQFRLEYLESMHNKLMISDMDYNDEKMLLAQAEKQFSENTKGLELAKIQAKEAQDRVKSMPEYQTPNLDDILVPLKAAIDAQQALINELSLQIDNLEITAPISGTICAIHRWPGQTIRSGDPILTIAADEARYIVSYIRQEQIMRPEPGAEVLVKARAPKADSLAATVEKVGSQIELIPEHQLRNVKMPEWGIPIRISIPKNLDVKPGELIDISLLSH